MKGPDQDSEKRGDVALQVCVLKDKMLADFFLGRICGKKKKVGLHERCSDGIC